MTANHNDWCYAHGRPYVQKTATTYTAGREQIRKFLYTWSSKIAVFFSPRKI